SWGGAAEILNDTAWAAAGYSRASITRWYFEQVHPVRKARRLGDCGWGLTLSMARETI
ncbi:hypothetical protein ACLOJK_034630, partial [Asimina triloba]